jgi:thiaminase
LQEDFKLMAEKTNNPVHLREYYTAKVLSYTKYRDEAFNTWRIADHTGAGIVLGEAASSYIKFQRKVATMDEHPYMFAVANYACYRLWPEVANTLSTRWPKPQPPYDQWVKSMQDPTFHSATKLAQTVETALPSDAHDSNSSTYTAVKEVLYEGLKHEVEFFNDYIA